MVKNLPAMWKTQLQSLGQEDPLEKGMANHSRILLINCTKPSVVGDGAWLSKKAC